MGVIKAIIGGLVGAVVATVILMFIRNGTLRGYEWFPIVTGLLTGIGTRVLAGSSSVSAYFTGGVAALISLVAILGGDEAVEMWKLRNLDLGPAPGMVTRAVAKAAAPEADSDPADADGTDETPMAAEGEDGAEQDTADDAAPDADSSDVAAASGVDRAATGRSQAATRDLLGGNEAVSTRKPIKDWRDYLPYVFSGIGVLLAYQVGGGGNRRRHVPTTESRDPHADDDDVAV